VPSIIAGNFDEVKEKIGRLEGITEWAHLDIVDGEFAKPAAWPYLQANAELAEQLNELETSLKLELHLMVADPEEDLDEWLQTPAKRVLVHAESSGNLEETELVLDMTDIKWGVALNMTTPITTVKDYIDKLDVLQLMGIDVIGESGHRFNDKVLVKIRAAKRHWPRLPVQVDGGVNESNVELLQRAGCDRAVVGSAIWRSKDPIKAIEKLKNAFA